MVILCMLLFCVYFMYSQSITFQDVIFYFLPFVENNWKPSKRYEVEFKCRVSRLLGLTLYLTWTNKSEKSGFIPLFTIVAVKRDFAISILPTK